jgi:hypothetical protein
MLGIRKKQAWVTRLGVVPGTRRHGVGSALMDSVLEQVKAIGVEEIRLEVIKNNIPAYNLFLNKGFAEAGEYLILRRAPYPIHMHVSGEMEPLHYKEVLRLLSASPAHPTWINSLESMSNALDLEGMRVRLPNGDTGWIAYRTNKYTLKLSLSHILIFTEQGDAQSVANALLLNLHLRYPRHDTYAENIYKGDPHLPAFYDLGYFENFSRIEMIRPAPSATP